MGIRSTLASLLSAPLAAALEERIRTIAQEVLERRDTASPADLRDLATRIEGTRRSVSELTAQLATLQTTVDAIATSTEDDADLALQMATLGARDEDLSSRLDALQATLSSLGTKVTDLQKTAKATESRAQSASTTAKAATTAATSAKKATAKAAASSDDKGCKVDGCTSNHRARGFCGRHYQMWKRNTLPGFVGADGIVSFEEGGPTWKVDDTYAGEPATLDGKRILVDGTPRRAKSLS